MNFVPKNYNEKRLTLDFTNGVAHLHDMICDCPKPLEHSIQLLINQEPNLKFNKKTSDQLKKCLTTGEEPATAVDALDGLTPGDLDALFAEDDTADTG